MPCTTVDHVYPRPLAGGPTPPGTQCWCGKRIWGGPVASVPLIPRPSLSKPEVAPDDRP